jgi:hypothetical protein
VPRAKAGASSSQSEHQRYGAHALQGCRLMRHRPRRVARLDPADAAPRCAITCTGPNGARLQSMLRRNSSGSQWPASTRRPSPGYLPPIWGAVLCIVAPVARTATDRVTISGLYYRDRRRRMRRDAFAGTKTAISLDLLAGNRRPDGMNFSCGSGICELAPQVVHVDGNDAGTDARRRDHRALPREQLSEPRGRGAA